jgi:hypothetical protein
MAAQTYFHSILSTHRNALIYKRKFFSDDARNPNNDPSKIFAHDVEGKFARFEFSEVSATIDNDRSTFPLTAANRSISAGFKSTVTRLSTAGLASPDRLRIKGVRQQPHFWR